MREFATNIDDDDDDDGDDDDDDGAQLRGVGAC